MLNNTEVIIECLSFFTFITFSFGFCLLILLFSWVLGGKSESRYKNTAFESGIIPVGNTKLHFSVKFYLVAIFFVIFDMEALYLYAWSSSIRETGWVGFFEASMFIASILLGLYYLVRTKAID